MDTINAGDTAWILVATALVMVMTPALAFFYGGMVRKKNLLSTINLSFITVGLDQPAMGARGIHPGIRHKPGRPDWRIEFPWLSLEWGLNLMLITQPPFHTLPSRRTR